MRSKNSIKQIIIVSIASLCVGLMIGSLIRSWVWGAGGFRYCALHWVIPG